MTRTSAEAVSHSRSEPVGHVIRTLTFAEPIPQLPIEIDQPRPPSSSTETSSPRALTFAFSIACRVASESFSGTSSTVVSATSRGLDLDVAGGLRTFRRARSVGNLCMPLPPPRRVGLTMRSSWAATCGAQ